MREASSQGLQEYSLQRSQNCAPGERQLREAKRQKVQRIAEAENRVAGEGGMQLQEKINNSVGAMHLQPDSAIPHAHASLLPQRQSLGHGNCSVCAAQVALCAHSFLPPPHHQMQRQTHCDVKVQTEQAGRLIQNSENLRESEQRQMRLQVESGANSIQNLPVPQDGDTEDLRAKPNSQKGNLEFCCGAGQAAVSQNCAQT
jgi:hypothetical protein